MSSQSQQRITISLQERPYQILFFLGALMAIAGVSLWPFFDVGMLGFFPAPHHADLMICSFLLSFVSGFLFTAGPKFTASHLPAKWQVVFQFTTILSGALISIAGEIKWALVLQLISLVNLVVFLAIRFFSRKNTPPPNFIFVPIGLLMGLTGITLKLYYYFYLPSDGVFNFSKVLLYRGFIYALFLGIGGRLFPALMGHAEILRINAPNTAKFGSLTPKLMISVALFVTAIMINLFSSRAGDIVLALATINVAVNNWHILKLPARRQTHAYALYIGLWPLILGPLLAGIFPDFEVHFHHLAYIGGFGLLTLTIAMRVILSHGGHDVLKGESSPVILIITALAILSMSLRAYSVHIDNTWGMIHLSGYIWISMVLMWLWFMSMKIFKTAIP